MNPGTSRKQSKILVEELKRRSKKPLEFAKKTILAEKIEYRQLREALEHYILHWNDFTHSGSFSIACEGVGGNLTAGTRVQAAITMIAAALDIHDDVIDKSEMKHGLPTVFGKFGCDIALLLGNAFLVEGFSLLAESTSDLPQEKIEEIRAILKRALFEVGNGHALELNLRERTSANLEEYIGIFRMKAASIEADFRIGAILGNGTRSEIDAMAKYGRILGTLTQLREEFIDIFEVEELNQRIRSEYLPLPILVAMQDSESKERIQELTSRGRVRNSNVDELIRIVFKSRSVEKLRGTMEKLVAESISFTSTIERKGIRDLLSHLASSMLEDL
ncbi:MAG: polyprenyl synthetase family protein [Candidatus Bathyarchaeia archaeon]